MVSNRSLAACSERRLGCAASVLAVALSALILPGCGADALQGGSGGGGSGGPSAPAASAGQNSGGTAPSSGNGGCSVGPGPAGGETSSGALPGGACEGVSIHAVFVPSCPQGGCTGPRVGDPGSVFDQTRAAPDYPNSLLTAEKIDCPEAEGWAAVGVEGGIPAVEEVAVTLAPGDDIQAAMSSLPKPADPSKPDKYYVVKLSAGCYEINGGAENVDLLTVPAGVILRGEARDSVVLKFFTKNGRDRASIKVNGSAGLENLTVTNAFVLSQPESKYLGVLDNFPEPEGFLGGVFLSGRNAWMQGCHMVKVGTNPVNTWGCNHCTLRDNVVEKSYNKGGQGNGYYYIGSTVNSLFYHESVSNIRHFAFNTLGQKNCNNVVLDLYTEVDINYHSDGLARTLVEGVISKVPQSHHWGKELGFGFNGKGMYPSNLHYRVDKFPSQDKVYRFTSSGRLVEAETAPPASGTLYPVTGWR